ncbi:hypothetical protein HT031_001938 [Scenedesmus sp. PABB004]|nr:hypothetical protein HT031_001938 [Scenedesmus sp. PABB004]
MAPAAAPPLLAVLPATAFELAQPAGADLALEALLGAASGRPNQPPAVLQCAGPGGGAPAPRLLSLAALPRHGGAAVVGLAPPAPARRGGGGDRGADFTAALVQHAAALLLLVGSDACVLVCPPGGAVSPPALQALRVLARVRAAALQQARAEGGAGEGEQQQGPAAALLRLLRAPPAQLHVLLQAPPADAAAAVQQAQAAVLGCGAAAVAGPGGGPRPRRGGTAASPATWELAGVHACSGDASPAQAARRAVLRAVAAQLQQAPQAQQASQAQQPGLPQALAAVVATAAGAAAGARRRPAAVSVAELPELWDQLAALLFPGARQEAAGPWCGHPLHPRAWLTLDDAPQGVAPAPARQSSDGGGSGDGGWLEVAQQEAPDEEEDEAGGAAGPGEVLAAAVDPKHAASRRRCLAAARGALAAYLQAVPARYTEAVHQAAAEHALAHYRAGAAGPAAPELQQLLADACSAAWRGRQRCAALSLTGRACRLSPHGPDTPHDSGTELHVAAPDGGAVARQPDWFDLASANAAPAAQQQRQRQQPQHQQQGQAQPPATQAKHKQPPAQEEQQQPQLGELLDVFAQLQAAVAGSGGGEALPSLLPEGAAGQEAGQARPADRGGAGAGAAVPLGPWLSMWRLGPAASYDAAAGLPGPGWAGGANKLLQLELPSPAPEPAEPVDAGGGPGRGAAEAPVAAAAGGPVRGSWGRGRPGASRAVVELGPEDFPTLSETLGRKAHAAGGPQRPRHGGGTPQPAGADRDRALQQLLVEAWELLGQRRGAGSPGAAAADGGGGGGRGAARSRSGAKAAAVAAGRGGDGAAAGGGPPVLAQLWIGLEYESLAGQRCLLRPAQLLRGLLQRHEHERAQEAAAAVAASAAAASAARNLGGADAQPQQQQQHQQEQAHRRGGSRQPQPAVAGGGRGSDVAGAEQLLLQDLPLFLQPAAAAAGAGPSGGSRRGGGAALPPAGEDAELGVTPLELLQLQRIYVVTPPPPFALAAQPRLRLARAGAAGAGGAPSIEFAAAGEARLPPDALVVLNLPKVYAAPADWVHVGGGDGPQQQQLQPLVPAADGGGGRGGGGEWRGWLRGGWLRPAGAA